MQFVYVNDLVHAMIRSMEEPRAVGEAFNIGDASGSGEKRRWRDCGLRGWRCA
jgi:nucleoside-diphosphate-sugar epimerase